MKLTTWPDVTPINQKNYYTYDYPFSRKRTPTDAAVVIT
jgi:hypothetical protein